MNKIQKKLLKQKKTVDIHGIIDPDMVEYVREALDLLELEDSPDITIKFTSIGGDADVGLDIYDLFRFYTGYKIGIVKGYANSMASTILQACDWRVITPSGHILIHHITWNIPLINLRDEQWKNGKWQHIPLQY